ncbi:MAG: hypothetical protein U0R72_15515 [Nakamurella multipartita]
MDFTIAIAGIMRTSPICIAPGTEQREHQPSSQHFIGNADFQHDQPGSNSITS